MAISSPERRFADLSFHRRKDEPAGLSIGQ
jgi:hypothetical protein